MLNPEDTGHSYVKLTCKTRRSTRNTRADSQNYGTRWGLGIRQKNSGQPHGDGERISRQARRRGREREGTGRRLRQDQSQGPCLRAGAGDLVGGFTRASTTKPDGKEERGTKTSQLRFLIWRIDNGTVVWFAFRGEGKGSVEPAASFTPDGRHFATLDETGLAQIYTVSQDQTEVSQKPS